MAVNIENIMNEIRQEIKEKGYTYDMLSFSEVSVANSICSECTSMAEIEDDLHYLNTSYTVASHNPIAGNKIFSIFKKIIRKLIKFYIEPIVYAQNEFNAVNVRLLNNLTALIKKRSDQKKNDENDVRELSDKLSTLELQLKTAASEIRMLNERIALLERENKELKEKAK